MNKLSLFSKLTIFVILSILFVVPAIIAALIPMIPAADQPGFGHMGRVSVYGERTFTQYFVSKNKNLVSVATTIKNPNLNNKKEIFFKLYDESGNLLRLNTLNGFNISDGDFVKIIFDVIPDSMNKKYYFTLSSPSAGEEEIIEIFLTDETDAILSYVYDEESHSGGAPIVTFHKPDSRLETVKLVYSNLFSKLLR